MKNTLIMDTLQGCIYSNQIVSEQNEEDILSIRVENTSANPKLDIYWGNEYAETIDMELSEDATATLDIPKKYYQKGNMLKVRFKDDNAIYKFMHFIHDAKIGKGLRVEKIVNTVFQVKFDEELDRLGYLELTYDLHKQIKSVSDKDGNGNYVHILKPFGAHAEQYSQDSDMPEVDRMPKFPYEVYVDWGYGTFEKFTITDYDQIKKIQHAYLHDNDNELINDPHFVTIRVKFEGIKSLEMMFGNYSYNALIKVDGELVGCENAEVFNGLFNAQTYLTEIGKDVFVNCTNMKNASVLFNSTGIETIPKGLLKNCKNIIYANFLFVNCFNLKNIPEDLFDSFVNCKQLAGVFSYCTSLETYPINLFDVLSGYKVKYINNAFEHCTSLKGKVRNLEKLFQNANATNAYAYCNFNAITIV